MVQNAFGYCNNSFSSTNNGTIFIIFILSSISKIVLLDRCYNIRAQYPNMKWMRTTIEWRNKNAIDFSNET